MRFSTLADWLSWMEGLHPTEIELGLKRVAEVANRLELLNPNATVVTVAGTNGKGSCVQALSHLLKAEDKTVGAFTSPHILQYNERIAVNGEHANDDEICRAFSAIDNARGDISLTYFEFGTLAALWVFNERKLDYWLLEVGLGGRLDAVNILDADLAILTSVDLDHEAWLGSDREVIGREKAGVLRQGRPFICAEQRVPKSVINIAEELSCNSYWYGEHFSATANKNTLGIELANVEKNDSSTIRLESYHLPPPSLAAAAQAFLILIGKEPSADLLGNISLPGRYERVRYQSLDCIVDVAHNPHAAALLASRLRSEFGKKIPAVFACMSDKDISGIVKTLLTQVSEWHCVNIEGNDRAAKADELTEMVSNQSLGGDSVNVFEYASLREALQLLKDKAPNEPILIFGTFFLVSEFKEIVNNTL